MYLLCDLSHENPSAFFPSEDSFLKDRMYVNPSPNNDWVIRQINNL